MTSAPLPVRIVVGALLLAVPTMLAMAAVPRLIFGLRTEGAHRLVLSATLGQNIPFESAKSAAAAFSLAPADDGDDEAWSAEFLAMASRGDPNVLAQARQRAGEALAHAPANPRAWTLYCALEADRDRASGVHCLDTGFYLSRYDWFTAAWRMRVVAYEWPFLDEKLHDAATALVIPMWNTTQWGNGLNLRGALYDLSRINNGRQLLRAGLVSDRETLRSFNRFVIQERIDGH